MRLPFAPRPYAGEALSSWVARLAAHNFVDAETFWAWLGEGPVDDLKPSAEVVHRLSEVSGVSHAEIKTLAGPLHRARRDYILNVLPTTGLRGAACAACLVENEEAGEDHWLPGFAASIWTVTCPRHARHLLDLRGFGWQFDGAKLRLGYGLRLGSGGLPRAAKTPSKLLTICEAAFRRVAVGRSPGFAWRTRNAGEFRECIKALAAPICWRSGTGGASFARQFDEAGSFGGLSFYISEPYSDRVFAALAGEHVRTRASVVAAIGHLLLKPDALTALSREQTLPVDLCANTFSKLVEFLNPAQRDRLVQCSIGLPDCVRQPLHAAIGEAHPVNFESQLFRAHERTISPQNLAERRNSDGVSSIPLQ